MLKNQSKVIKSHFKPHNFDLSALEKQKFPLGTEICHLDLTINYLHNRNADFIGIQVRAVQISKYDATIIVQDDLPVYPSEKELLEDYPSITDLLKAFSHSCNWRLVNSNMKRVLCAASISGNDGLYELPKQAPFFCYET